MGQMLLQRMSKSNNWKLDAKDQYLKSFRLLEENSSKAAATLYKTKPDQSCLCHSGPITA